MFRSLQNTIITIIHHIIKATSFNITEIHQLIFILKAARFLFYILKNIQFVKTVILTYNAYTCNLYQNAQILDM